VSKISVICQSLLVIVDDDDDDDDDVGDPFLRQWVTSLFR